MRIWGFCGWNNFHLILVQPADNQQPPQNTWPIILLDELSRRLNIILLSFVFIKGHFAVWYTHLWTMTTHSESLFSIHQHQVWSCGWMAFPAILCESDMMGWKRTVLIWWSGHSVSSKKCRYDKPILKVHWRP